MSGTPALLAAVDISRHADGVTSLLLAGVAMVGLFFLLRPEIWRRVFLDRVDPRPAGLLRIAYGVVLFGTLLTLLPQVRMLLTDEGLWLTDTARDKFGSSIGHLWDAKQGFEHWWHLFPAMWGKFSIFHLRNDPAFVYTVYALTMVSIGLMMLGIWTRWVTLVTWILILQIYGYSSIFYSAGDLVIQAFMFLGMLTRWGEAYSLDSWRRRRRAVLDGASAIPPHRRIPAWPMRLMMWQLTLIYCATGLLKTGVTWDNGTALYFAMNLDRFYRFEMMTPVAIAQSIGLLPFMTWFTHAWEILFPLALIGVAINAYERDRAEKVWITVPHWRRLASWSCFAAIWAILAYVAGVAAYYYQSPAVLPFAIEQRPLGMLTGVVVALVPVLAVAGYRVMRRSRPRTFDCVRHWLLGRRFWLICGLTLHAGIWVTLNVGTFTWAMIAIYLPWLRGTDLDGFWRWLLCRRPGEPYVVRHHPDEAGVRRAALLRMLDGDRRLRFESCATVPRDALELSVAGAPPVKGTAAAAALLPIFPGLWWLRPLHRLPGLRRPTAHLAARLLGQTRDRP